MQLNIQSSHAQVVAHARKSKGQKRVLLLGYVLELKGKKYGLRP